MGPNTHALVRSNKASQERRELRDYFATIALSVALEKGSVAADRTKAIWAVGRDCYAIADSMLAAREAG